MASHAYLLASFELNSAPEMADSFSAGVGIEAGWLITQTHQDRWQLSAQWMAQTESSLHTRSALSLKWNKVLNKDWAVRTTLSHQQWQAEEQALSISLLHYF